MLFVLIFIILLILMLIVVGIGFVLALVSILSLVPLTGFYLVFVTHEYSTAESSAYALLEAHPVVILLGSLVVLFIAYEVCSFSRLGLSMLVSHLVPIFVYEFFDDLNIWIYIITGIVVIPAGFLIWYFIDKVGSKGTIFGIIMGGILMLSEVSMYWTYTLGHGTLISDSVVVILANIIAILVTVATYFVGINLSKK